MALLHVGRPTEYDRLECLSLLLFMRPLPTEPNRQLLCLALNSHRALGLPTSGTLGHVLVAQKYTKYVPKLTHKPSEITSARYGIVAPRHLKRSGARFRGSTNLSYRRTSCETRT